VAPIKILIDTTIRNGVAQELKAAGFKKEDRTWRRPAALGTQVLNIQANKWNEASDGSFTINLGVYFPAAVTLHGRGEPTARPFEYDCFVRERIGFLRPEGSDFWWTIGASTNLELLGQQVASDLVRYGLPWLESVSSYAGARQYLAGTKSWFSAALLSLLLDEQEVANSFFQSAIDATMTAGTRQRLIDWGARMGLQPRRPN